MNIECLSSTTLANYVGSVLSHSLNRVYLVRATPSLKFLASLGTSDTPRTLFRRTNTALEHSY